MMKWMVILLFPFAAYGQNIKVTASPQRVLIGDHIRLKVEVDAGGQKFERIDWSPIDTSSHFDMIDPGSPLSTEDGRGLVQEMVITSFDSGTFYVPSIRALFDKGTGNNAVLSNPIPIEVGVVAPDSVGLVPIKDIIEEKITWQDYLAYLSIPAVLLFLGIVLYLWTKRKDKDSDDFMVEVLIPAHERALTDLEELEGEELWQQGAYKEFEVRLSTIFRRYIEEQFKFPALEWTRREIIGHLSKLPSEGLPLALVDEVLTQADMVKYAKAQPEADQLSGQTEKVRQWVLLTKDWKEEEE